MRENIGEEHILDACTRRPSQRAEVQITIGPPIRWPVRIQGERQRTSSFFDDPKTSSCIDSFPVSQATCTGGHGRKTVIVQSASINLPLTQFQMLVDKSTNSQMASTLPVCTQFCKASLRTWAATSFFRVLMFRFTAVV